jgi:hypothetical protein
VVAGPSSADAHHPVLRKFGFRRRQNSLLEPAREGRLRRVAGPRWPGRMNWKALHGCEGVPAIMGTLNRRRRQPHSPISHKNETTPAIGMITKIAIPQSRTARESLCKGLMMGSVGHFRSHGHFSRKRQKSERPEADRRKYSRSRSHLRAAVAMIGIKSPGLDGGVYGGTRQDRDRSWGRAVRPYYLGGALCLTRLSSIGAARLAAPFLGSEGSDRSGPIF